MESLPSFGRLLSCRFDVELIKSFSHATTPNFTKKNKKQVLDAKEVVNKKRPDGSAIKIAECNVGDASGTIMFTARNKQGTNTCRASHVASDAKPPDGTPRVPRDAVRRLKDQLRNKLTLLHSAPLHSVYLILFFFCSGLDEGGKHGDYPQWED